MKAGPCPATLALQKKLTQAANTCAGCAPQVEYLEQLAGVCPELAVEVNKLRTFLDHLTVMADVGLTGVQEANNGTLET